MKIGYAGGTKDSADLKAQVDALQKMGCAKIFEDRGVVDANSREGSGLERALGAVTTGDVFVVSGLKCLGPGTKDVAQAVRALLRVGAYLQILRDEIDTTAPGGFQVFRLIRAFDELERGVASRRGRLAVEKGRLAGKQYGAQRTLDEEQEEYARDEVKRGRPAAEVAEELGVAAITIYRTLKRGARQPGRTRTEAGLAKAKANLRPQPRALTAAQEEFARKEAARGRRVQEIADELGVSKHTIYKALKRGV